MDNNENQIKIEEKYLLEFKTEKGYPINVECTKDQKLILETLSDIEVDDSLGKYYVINKLKFKIILKKDE